MYTLFLKRSKNVIDFIQSRKFDLILISIIIIIEQNTCLLLISKVLIIYAEFNKYKVSLY
jgi:hypothetical protein